LVVQLLIQRYSQISLALLLAYSIAVLRVFKQTRFYK